ncbi:MAG: hypothetical protein Q7T61_08820 [Caulobacter sp.]|nr:hypothetical protein [Caulobacter sp.]
MKSKLMTAVGCGAILLALGACESRAEYRARKAEQEALKVVSRLDCPETQGNLKRTAQGADGLSCAYAGEDSEVTLRLVAVSNDPSKALEPIETEIKGLFPEAPATPETPTPPAKPGEPASPPKSVTTTKERVSMPGLSVETEEGDGVDKAHVRMPGVSVNADGDNAHVRVMGIEINANDKENEVRIVRERWRGGDDGDFSIDTSEGKPDIDNDGFSLGGKRRQGYRSTFVKTTDDAGAAWTVAGYEAQGPKRGPLVVAIVKSKRKSDGDGESRHLFRDATSLVKKQFGE